jgi:hypothetical protein
MDTIRPVIPADGIIPGDGIWMMAIPVLRQMRLYTQFGDKRLELIVSDGYCNDTATALVSLDNELKAAFEASAYVCPADKASFNNQSTGRIVDWIWNLGDGTTDFKSTPSDHQYPNNPLADKTYYITLIVRDSLGCLDTARQTIVDLHSCAIAVPMHLRRL